jgi:hypothetical protein
MLSLGHPLFRNFSLEVQDTWETITILQPSPAIHRLLCSNWLSKCRLSPYIYDVMKALVEVQKRSPGLKLLWRFEANEDEVSEALTLVNAQQRPGLSQVLQKQRKDPCLWNTLLTFDTLVRDGFDLMQKGIMFALLINDLSVVKSPLYAN